MAVSLLVAMAAAAACSGDRPSLADEGVTIERVGPAKVATLDPSAVDLTIVATGAVLEVPVFDAPVLDGQGEPQPRHVLPNPVASGGPLVLVVRQTVGEWHEVLLPIAPNGSTGWVRDRDVALTRHNYRVDVSLDARRLEVYLRGERVRQVPIGVGRGCAALQTDTYFTTELLRPSTPDAVYGAYAYVLSGNGDDLAAFTGGDGELGIHAAADDTPIEDASAPGCIRARTTDLASLVDELPLGVPVTIGP